jgi:hypothetical protein
MSTGALDPLIHNPQRLRIIATLAALHDGDGITVTRLRNMIGLPPGGPIIGLRELGHAGYIRTGTTGGDTAPATIALTRQGRAARPARLCRLRRPPATTAGRAPS